MLQTVLVQILIMNINYVVIICYLIVVSTNNVFVYCVAFVDAAFPICVWLLFVPSFEYCVLLAVASFPLATVAWCLILTATAAVEWSQYQHLISFSFAPPSWLLCHTDNVPHSPLMFACRWRLYCISVPLYLTVVSCDSVAVAVAYPTVASVDAVDDSPTAACRMNRCSSAGWSWLRLRCHRIDDRALC